MSKTHWMSPKFLCIYSYSCSSPPYYLCTKNKHILSVLFFFLFIYLFFFPPGIWRNNHTQAYTQPEKEVSVKPPWETHYTYTYHHLGSAFTRVKLLRNTPVWQTESRLMDKDAPYTVSPNNHAVHAKFLQLQYYCVPRYIKSQAPSLKNTSGDHLTWRQATVLLSLLSFSLEKALLKSL